MPEATRQDLNIPVRNHGIDPMAIRREAPQLHFLGVFDLFGVAVAPLERHLAVGVRVDQHVEGAVAVEHWQEGDRRRDLPEQRLDLLLDLGLGFVGGGRGGGRWRGVFLVVGGLLGLCAVIVEDVDLDHVSRR